MATVKVEGKLKLHIHNFQRLRTLPQMERLANRACEATAQQAGADYGEPGEFGWATSPGTERAAGAVFGETFHADADVAKYPFKLVGAMRAVRRVVV